MKNITAATKGRHGARSIAERQNTSLRNRSKNTPPPTIKKFSWEKTDDTND